MHAELLSPAAVCRLQHSKDGSIGVGTAALSSGPSQRLLQRPVAVQAMRASLLLSTATVQSSRCMLGKLHHKRAQS